MIEIFVRDPDLALTDQVTDFSKFTAIPRWCDIGAASLDMPFSTISAALTEPGSGIIVESDGEVVWSGITSQPERQFSASADGHLLSFVSDEVVLNDRLAYPSAPVAQGDGTHKMPAAAYDVRTGVTETVMHQYVRANAGPTNVSYPWTRPVSVLSFASNLARGPSITARARNETLLVLLQEINVLTGLGFRVLNMQFGVRVPVDRAAEIAFSTEIGNLAEFRYLTTRPTVTHPVVAGGGEGVNRIFYLAGDSTAATRWGWSIEKFRDRRDTVDPVELEKTSDEEIAKGAEAASFSLTPLDIEGYAFGADYQLGDVVTGEIDGNAIEGSIKQVTITLDSNGQLVKPDFSSATGAQTAFTLKTFDLLRDLTRRTSALERGL
jgi:hypothetical protein